MKTVDIPKGKWKVVLDGAQISEKGLSDFKGTQYNMPPISGVILVK
jgi:hypothetical protein